MKKLTFLFLGLAATAFTMTSCGGGAETTEPTADTTAVTQEPAAAPVADYSAGKAIYDAKCKVCHQETGAGLAPAFPPLAGSDFLKDNVKKSMQYIKNGITEPVMVNGTEYKSKAMIPMNLTDQEVVDVTNYILNSWGNTYGNVTLEDLAAQ